MKKHIIYLITGLIVGLILGMPVSAGGQEAEVKEEEVIAKKTEEELRKYLNPDYPTYDLIKDLDEKLISQYMDAIKMVNLAQETGNPAYTNLSINFFVMKLSVNTFIQNQRLLLQNEQIIELLEEIRDK